MSHYTVMILTKSPTEEALGLIGSLDGEVWLTVVDCHI